MEKQYIYVKYNVMLISTDLLKVAINVIVDVDMYFNKSNFIDPSLVE